MSQRNQSTPNVRNLLPFWALVAALAFFGLDRFGAFDSLSGPEADKVAQKIEPAKPVTQSVSLIQEDGKVLFQTIENRKSLVLPTEEISPKELEALKNDYQAKIESWRETIKNIRTVGLKYFDCEMEEAGDLRKEWNALYAQGDRQAKELSTVVVNLYPHWHDTHLAELYRRVMEKRLANGRAAEVFDMGRLLLAEYPEDGFAQFATAQAALRINEFDYAQNFVDNYSVILSEQSQEVKDEFKALTELKNIWKAELALQAEDAEKGDLPRVSFETSKGKVVIELFEDQAPNTVANFLQLVEIGYYDGKIFHRVIQGFMAQGGTFDQQGQSTPLDYSIPDEHTRPDARNHFRGTISMAKTNDPNTAQAGFFFCFQPTTHLNKMHTAFGRVVEGMETVDLITRNFVDKDGKEEPIPNAEPDYIISAKVERKRDKEYKINKIYR